MSIAEHPTTLTNLFNTMRYFTNLLTAKQASTHRTMLGCVIFRHRLMTRDQPPLIKGKILAHSWTHGGYIYSQPTAKHLGLAVQDGCIGSNEKKQQHRGGLSI